MLYRTEGWAFLLAGGGLYSNLDYSFTPAHPDGTFLDYASPGGGNPAFRKQMRVLKDFVHSFDFMRMRPLRSVVEAPEGLAVQALVEPGRQYAVYLHQPIGEGSFAPAPRPIARPRSSAAVAIALELPRGRYRAEWVDPKTGAVLKAEELGHAGGTCRLTSPAFAEDAALAVRRRP